MCEHQGGMCKENLGELKWKALSGVGNEMTGVGQSHSDMLMGLM